MVNTVCFALNIALNLALNSLNLLYLQLLAVLALNAVDNRLYVRGQGTGELQPDDMIDNPQRHALRVHLDKVLEAVLQVDVDEDVAERLDSHQRGLLVTEGGHDSIDELNNEQVHRQLEYGVLELSEREVPAPCHADAVSPHTADDISTERDYEGYDEALCRRYVREERADKADGNEPYMFEVERFHKH